MLTITIGGDESWDEVTETFTDPAPIQVLKFEHSLASVSKWESKYQVPFLSGHERSDEQARYYLRCMLLTEGVHESTLKSFSPKNMEDIQEYIQSTQSATTFAELPDRQVSGEMITSELIYYWMVGFQIPFECQYWHLNRLFSLIRVCNVKQGKQKKMSAAQIAERNRAINEANRKHFNTAG